MWLHCNWNGWYLTISICCWFLGCGSIWIAAPVGPRWVPCRYNDPPVMHVEYLYWTLDNWSCTLSIPTKNTTDIDGHGRAIKFFAHTRTWRMPNTKLDTNGKKKKKQTKKLVQRNKEQRYQWGLQIYKLDNKQIAMISIWALEGSISHKPDDDNNNKSGNVYSLENMNITKVFLMHHITVMRSLLHCDSR
jgi:hypothetical protein